MLKIWRVCPYHYNNDRISCAVTLSSVCSHLFSTSTPCNTLPFLEKAHPPKSKRRQPAAPPPTSENKKFAQRVVHAALSSDIELLLKVIFLRPSPLCILLTDGFELNTPSTASRSQRNHISSLLSQRLKNVPPNKALSIGNFSLGEYAEDVDIAPIEFIVQVIFTLIPSNLVCMFLRKTDRTKNGQTRFPQFSIRKGLFLSSLTKRWVFEF